MRRPAVSFRAAVAIVAAVALVLAGCDSGDTKATVPRPAPSDLVDAACAKQLVASVTGKIESPEQTESSGLVVSKENPGTLWVNNDSGDSARVFAIAPTGKLQGIYALSGATAIDWEDIAIGPGPEAKRSYLYIADIGDNAQQRPDIVLYRVAEPEVAGDGSTQTLDGVEALTLRYPDTGHDAEALMIDPRTGDIYVIVKQLAGGPAPVYRAPIGLAPGSTTVLSQVGRLDLPVGPVVYAVTGADISADGSIIGVRTYGGVRLWKRGKDQSVIAALAAKPCSGPVPAELQGEAIGIQPDDGGYFTVAEGTQRPLHHVGVPER